jgi:HEAT repeat protein
MPADTSVLLMACTFGLLGALVVLVLGKRFIRGAAERRSRRRRVRWVAAIGTGPVPDMRMGELRALAREASRSARAQEDLLALLAAGRLPPGDDRRRPFDAALRRGGLRRALRSAARSRRAVVRGRAALLTARLGFERSELVIAPLIADPDPDVRAAATQALAYCGSEEAAWALLRALREGHVEPGRAVERLTAEWAVRPLLGALHEPAFAAVRPWIAEALGLTQDPRAEMPLVRVLGSGDEEERIRACRALGRLGRVTSSAALMAALSDGSPSVRAQAARALGSLGETRSVPALVALLGDRSWWVRGRAAEALRAVGAPGLEALRRCARSHTDPFARERAAEALTLAPAADPFPPRPAVVPEVAAA